MADKLTCDERMDLAKEEIIMVVREILGDLAVTLAELSETSRSLP